MEPRDTHSNFFQGRVSKELKHRRDEEERKDSEHGRCGPTPEYMVIVPGGRNKQDLPRHKLGLLSKNRMKIKIAIACLLHTFCVSLCRARRGEGRADHTPS